MRQAFERFRKIATERFGVGGLAFRSQADPFRIAMRCDLPAIGPMRIEPFGARHFKAFQDFQDGQHPEWGMSRQSMQRFQEHAWDIATLRGIARRVENRQDARFVILTAGHVVGYILIEEIDCIHSGRKTYYGGDCHAMIGIGISDRFHGTGLAGLAMLFLKLVAAVAGVGLGLCFDPANARARRFYEKHRFIPAGRKVIFVPHTGQRSVEPWWILRTNELAGP